MRSPSSCGPSLGETDQAVERTVTVLVIACPHALGLAIPLTIAVSTGIAARAGILVKNRLALERMRTIDAVLFDKTGTLTTGQHAVTGVVADGLDDDELLALAAAVEADSEHPLARAIVAAAQDGGVVRARRDPASGRSPAAASRPTVDGDRSRSAGRRCSANGNLTEPEAIAARTAEWRARGASVLHVVRDGRVVGALALEDQIRPESRAAVDELHRLGVRVVMITGDARQVADAVGAALGVDEVFAEVLPEDKDRGRRRPPGPWVEGRHGRRRRQRRPRPRPRRCRHRHRRRHRRRHRVRRRRARLQRPARRASASSASRGPATARWSRTSRGARATTCSPSPSPPACSRSPGSRCRRRSAPS